MSAATVVVIAALVTLGGVCAMVALTVHTGRAQRRFMLASTARADALAERIAELDAEISALRWRP